MGVWGGATSHRAAQWVPHLPRVQAPVPVWEWALLLVSVTLCLLMVSSRSINWRVAWLRPSLIPAPLLSNVGFRLPTAGFFLSEKVYTTVTKKEGKIDV